jgi:molecular chaperone GrpE
MTEEFTSIDGDNQKAGQKMSEEKDKKETSFEESEGTKETQISDGTLEAALNNEAVEEPSVDWKAQAAYMAAEVENMKKRFMRDASDIRKFANEDLLRNLVPVLDTLLLALQAADKAKTQDPSLLENKVFASFIQGVEMTSKQFEQVLEASGVEFLASKGTAFDPALHEALGQVEVADLEDNMIAEEFQRGFKLAGRVVRPAKVIVNKKSKEENI